MLKLEIPEADFDPIHTLILAFDCAVQAWAVSGMTLQVCFDQDDSRMLRNAYSLASLRAFQ